MAEGQSASDRLDRVEARIAIADLVHEYARLVRHDRPDEVAGLFAPEGWFEIRDGHPSKSEYGVRQHLGSPEAIGAYLENGKGRAQPLPMIHNLMIELDGDRATANSLMEAQVYGTPMRTIGEYRDSFRRVDGTWRFASRIYTIFAGASNV